MNFTPRSESAQSLTNYPPMSNRGVAPALRPQTGQRHTDSPQNSVKLSKSLFLDWYQCSFSLKDINPQDLAYSIASNYGCVIERSDAVQRPYKMCHAVVSHETRAYKKPTTYATIHHGGHNERFLVRFSSDRAISGSQFLRQYHPDHIVSRLDVALDFDASAGFEKMVSWFVDYAKKNKLKTSQAGDWLNAVGGRTLYIGSRQSLVYIRIYEKGIEQIDKKLNVHASPDWYRVEFEIKPQTADGKRLFSTITPEDALNCSPIMREFKERIMNKMADPISISAVRSRTGQDSAFRHMRYQYGKILETHLEESGFDYEEFGKTMMSMILQERRIHIEKMGAIDQLRLDRGDVDSPAMELSPLWSVRRSH